MIPPNQEFQHEPTDEISIETMILTTWAHSQLMPQEAYDEIQELAQIIFDKLLDELNNFNDHLITLVATPSNTDFGPPVDMNFLIFSPDSKNIPDNRNTHTTISGKKIYLSIPPNLPPRVIAIALTSIGAIMVRTFTQRIDPITNLPLKRIGGYVISERNIIAASIPDLFNAECIDSITGEMKAPEPGVEYVELPTLTN